MAQRLNTGAPRSVSGHFISGALTAAVLSGSIVYGASKGSKKAALKKSVKVAIQSGTALSSAIAATNYIGQGRYANAALSLAIGVGSLYLIEKILPYKGNENG
ncbi:MAG: hypothetical protein LBS73_02235 [Campylobacteraceae bacterium]|jgi:hypothetical protein|nr:hypothetical protein [Campylobacteraceae bacterium]